MTRPQRFAGAHRVVVKIGSAVLREGPAFDRVTFASLVRDIAALREGGVEVVVVCSGAVALGMARLGMKQRPDRIEMLQATAAVGQGQLMRLWSDELSHYGLRAGQVLLTHDDLRDRRRFLSARHTLRALIELGAVPVINENDTVAFDEIKLGDNDLLSSQTVALVEAGMLVVLSDVAGYFDGDPGLPDSSRVSFVGRIDAAVLDAAGGSRSGLGSGGMRTKIGAVRQVNHLGVPGIIAHGKEPRVLQRLYAGDDLGTWFAPDAATVRSRKHWIAYASRPAGTIAVDAGAARALRAAGRSLLPIGVTRVDGDFGVGELVSIVGPDGAEFARGLVGHDAAALRGAVGRRGEALDASAPEVVHRDDLVILPSD